MQLRHALLGLVLTTPLLHAHGGVYRGPGSTVGPGAATSGGPSSNTGGFSDTDPAAWSQWWSFNRDSYLALREAVFAGTPTATGFDDFYLGRGGGFANQAGLRPEDKALYDHVVPALIAALERQKDTDIITACLMALAKIGDREDGYPGVASVIEPWLENGNQEIHETATIALGILGDPQAAPLLADLMLNREGARRRLRRASIPHRTQAFAAYGLAQIGFRSSAEAVRSYCVHELSAAVALGDKPERDRMVAAIIGIGVIRLEPEDPDGFDIEVERGAGISREGQLAFLWEYWQKPRLDPRVQAHIAVPLARLASGAHPEWKVRLGQSFAKTYGQHSKASAMVQQGAVLAAGLLGDNDQDAEDQRLRNSLNWVISEGGDRLSRHLALLSLARVGAREGTGPAGNAPAEARGLLMRLLARGGTAQRPWAALAVGLLERGNVAAGRAKAEGTRLALKDAFKKAASPSEQGALAIALGLVAETSATEELIERTGNGDENTRAHCMIALGLMGAQEAIATLQSVAGRSTYRPGLVREAAIALAMLGDKSVARGLVTRLTKSHKLFEQLAATWAIGFVGDSRVVMPLVEVLSNKRENDTTRAYAAVALGAICDKEAHSWNAKIAADVLWWQAPRTLFDPQGGKGVLDLL